MNIKKIIDSTYELIVKACLQKNITEKPKIILGFSGGPDSRFLLEVLALLHDEKKIDLIATHLDHEWRKESGQDLMWCQNVCEQKNIVFIGLRASDLVFNIKYNGSQEEIGRKLRRFLFNKVLQEQNAHFIALAHHAQDQQETFFMRLLRGATLQGLCCMKVIDGVYIRPLLHENKKDICVYLDKHKISYLYDKTNESDKYLRNRIRYHVLPALEKCDERFFQKFITTVESLQEEELFLQKLTIQEFNDIFTYERIGGWVGDVSAFCILDPVLQRRVILHWLIMQKVPFTPSSGFLHELCSFITSDRGGTHAVNTVWALCKKKRLFMLLLQKDA